MFNRRLLVYSSDNSGSKVPAVSAVSQRQQTSYLAETAGNQKESILC